MAGVVVSFNRAAVRSASRWFRPLSGLFGVCAWGMARSRSPKAAGIVDDPGLRPE